MSAQAVTAILGRKVHVLDRPHLEGPDHTRWVFDSAPEYCANARTVVELE